MKRDLVILPNGVGKRTLSGTARTLGEYETVDYTYGCLLQAKRNLLVKTILHMPGL
jgi:hypothetical protein